MGGGDGREVGTVRNEPLWRAGEKGLLEIMAFGNSDGDFEMLEWTTGREPGRVSDRRGFALIVHHTDAEREWAYDRESHIGRLAKGLDEAPKRGWIVVDMKQDWKRVFPFEEDK